MTIPNIFPVQVNNVPNFGTNTISVPNVYVPTWMNYERNVDHLTPPVVINIGNPIVDMPGCVKAHQDNQMHATGLPKDKEHQQFNNRINKLEKWVWGCSAVVAAVVTVGGILPKFINFGGGMGDLWWYAESNRKFLNEVVIPSLQKPGWESQFFKSWDKNGRWEQYN